MAEAVRSVAGLTGELAERRGERGVPVAVADRRELRHVDDGRERAVRRACSDASNLRTGYANSFDALLDDVAARQSL